MGKCKKKKERGKKKKNGGEKKRKLEVKGKINTKQGTNKVKKCMIGVGNNVS